MQRLEDLTYLKNYNPLNIEPQGSKFLPYEKIFGQNGRMNILYGYVTKLIIDKSQENGLWVPIDTIPNRCGVYTRDDMREEIGDMVEDEYLTEIVEGFMLSAKTLIGLTYHYRKINV